MKRKSTLLPKMRLTGAKLPVVHLVDDDVLFLRTVKRLLLAHGFFVRAFTSVAEFMKFHHGNTRGCVITDLKTPGVNGLELQAWIAGGTNPLPVIFLTGDASIPQSVAAMKGGAEDFLTKPVNRDMLISVVSAALIHDAESFSLRIKKERLRSRLLLLTARERDVLGQIITGKLNREIAEKLHASERTIKAHRARIMAKLEVRTAAELGTTAGKLELDAVISHRFQDETGNRHISPRS